jgi:hypothetical protein
VWNELPSARLTDESEGDNGVDEGADENSERHLVAEVPNEEPHHPRTELLGRERQGQDRDGEDHADDGDDGGRDGDEDLASCVGPPGQDPERECDVVVECRDVDRDRDREEHRCDHDHEAGNQPERGSQRFAAPTGEPSSPGARGRRDVRYDGLGLVGLGHRSRGGSIKDADQSSRHSR